MYHLILCITLHVQPEGTENLFLYALTMNYIQFMDSNGYYFSYICKTDLLMPF